MKFDLIIANPPYGKIGAMITDKIRKEVKYNHFVNLLPANDYKRVSNLHQYVRNMEAINNGFEDASVTTHLCKIVNEANGMSVEEFEISQYIDPQLDKYFRVLRTRTHDAIDAAVTNESVESVKLLNPKIAFMLGERDVNHKQLGLTNKALTYRWNVEKSIDADYLLSHVGRSSGGLKIHFGFIKFSELENTNFTNFVYTNHAFISKIFAAVNVDGSIAINKWAPKVDWTRAWTVEEILADYGYTETETADVIADLENFKDIERD